MVETRQLKEEEELFMIRVVEGMQVQAEPRRFYYDRATMLDLILLSHFHTPVWSLEVGHLRVRRILAFSSYERDFVFSLVLQVDSTSTLPNPYPRTCTDPHTPRVGALWRHP